MQSKIFEVSGSSRSQSCNIFSIALTYSAHFYFCYVDSTDPYKSSGKERKLGLVVARGTSVMTISPLQDMKEIQNPFGEKDTQI